MGEFRHAACPFRPFVVAQQSSVDTLAGSPAEPARPAGPSASAARPRRPNRKQFSLLIVRGDGTRVFRFNFPRPAAIAAFASFAIALTTFCGLLTDWLQLRQLTVEARTFKSQIAEQQASIDAFNRRVVELRTEMTSWRDLHARIWEPFGPELQPGGRDPAVGGGSLRVDPGTRPVSPQNQLQRLPEELTEQGQSVQAPEPRQARAP